MLACRENLLVRPETRSDPDIIGALSAHLRARDPGIGGAVTFLALAVAALIADLGYHNHW